MGDKIVIIPLTKKVKYSQVRFPIAPQDIVSSLLENNSDSSIGPKEGLLYAVESLD